MEQKELSYFYVTYENRTGIYHVMMCGINHQNIFEEHEDYYQFLNTLDMMAQSYERF